MRHPVQIAAMALAAFLMVPGGTARAEDTATQPPPQETARQVFERLEKAMSDSRAAAIEVYNAAVKKEQEAAEAEGRDAVLLAYDMSGNLAPHIVAFQAAAKGYANTDDAVQFLTWLAMAARKEEAGRAAFQTILATHLKSGEISRFVSLLPYLGRDLGPDAVRVLLDKLIADNPHVDVQAQALITRGEGRREKEPEAGRADIERAAALAEDAQIAGRAKGILNELDNLQMGSVAPEIEAADLDGVTFKLSDYRGKVVVLDFWGDW